MPDIQIVGHRGAKAEAPENTIAGVVHAKAIGLQAIEFDVHLTRDHQLAVIHDATVDRTTNASGAVADYTAAELAAMDARGTSPSWPEPVGVPTLDQFLDAVEDFSSIQIEIKRDTPERLEIVVADVIRQVNARSMGPQVTITSFDPKAMEIVQRLAPGQSRGFIGRPDDPEVVETSLRYGCDHVYFHNYREHAPEHIRRAHDAGLKVGGGPCDSIEDVEAAISLGMGPVTSDIPTTLRAYLATHETVT